MGYPLLILGVAVFALAHLFKRLAPARRAELGNSGRIIVTIAMFAGIILMVIGYRAAPVVQLWNPPQFLNHLNNLLMLIAFWFFALSAIPGTMSARIRHKQLTALKTWAIAHLLVNGDLASLILFGGLLAWAVFSVIKIKRAEPEWERPANASVKNDIIALGVAVVVMGLVGYIHGLLGYPVFG